MTDCCDFCDLFLVFDRVLIATFDIILYVTSTSSLRCLRFLNYSEGSHRGWKKEQKQRKQTREKEKKITWTTFWPLVPSYCLDVWMWRSTLHSFQHLAHPHHSKMSVSYSPSSSHFQVFDVFEIKFFGIIKQTCTLVKLCDLVGHMILFCLHCFLKDKHEVIFSEYALCFHPPTHKGNKKKKKPTVTSPGLWWRSMVFYRLFKRNCMQKVVVHVIFFLKNIVINLYTFLFLDLQKHNLSSTQRWGQLDHLTCYTCWAKISYNRMN